MRNSLIFLHCESAGLAPAFSLAWLERKTDFAGRSGHSAYFRDPGDTLTAMRADDMTLLKIADPSAK